MVLVNFLQPSLGGVDVDLGSLEECFSDAAAHHRVPSELRGHHVLGSLQRVFRRQELAAQRTQPVIVL